MNIVSIGLIIICIGIILFVGSIAKQSRKNLMQSQNDSDEALQGVWNAMSVGGKISYVKHEIRRNIFPKNIPEITRPPKTTGKYKRIRKEMPQQIVEDRPGMTEHQQPVIHLGERRHAIDRLFAGDRIERNEIHPRAFREFHIRPPIIRNNFQDELRIINIVPDIPPINPDPIMDEQPNVPKMLEVVNGEKIRANINGDAQNVHDTKILDDLIKLYEPIKLKYRNKDDHSINIEEIRRWMTPIYESKVKNRKGTGEILDAIRGLDAICIANTKIIKIGEDEITIASKIWEYIKSRDEGTNKETLKEALYSAFEDCVSAVHQLDNEPQTGTVCAVGRITRLMNILMLDEDKPDRLKVVPIWAYRQEMMDRASAISREMYENAPKNLVQDIKMGVDNDAVNVFAENVKNSIRAILKKEYVESGMLNAQAFLKETQWIDAL